MEKVLKLKAIFQDPDQTRSMLNSIKNFLLTVLRIAIIIGVSYVILSPVIGLIVNSISSNKDAYDPMVFVLPKFPTFEKYALVLKRMDYFPTIARDLLYTISLTLLELLVCSMVGYGFARFNFPFKNVLFACVVIMIVIPSHTIMLPLYMTFKNFDPFGLVSAIKGTSGLMGTVIPMYAMTLLGCGVRSGLYIYIFNQFFRGLPKEIEEAAFVDGAGTWYTYFRIMLVNAMPAVITVTVFSLVWQYTDSFYSQLFRIPTDMLLAKRLSTLQNNISANLKIMNVRIQRLYVDAGVVLTILPLLILYLLLQRRFIEGVERSGIVG